MKRGSIGKIPGYLRGWIIDWHDRITVDPKVLVGKPVIRGTRLSVEFIVELLANGWTVQQIVENYPNVVPDDILACLHYATDMLKSERVYLTAAGS